MRMFSFLLAAAVVAGMAGPAAAETIGTVQQPIIAGTLVDVATQRERGLVTVAGGCSGTLINQYWVLTAAHCISGKYPSQVTITAAWSPATVTPTRFIYNPVGQASWPARGFDVALIFLGDGDFGRVPLQLLNYNGLDTDMMVLKFGRGISAYATAGPPARAATRDGSYRSAIFGVSSIGQTTYTLRANSSGQVGNGGDSGGPDWTIGTGGTLVNIAGVQSTCRATGYVPGMPQDWGWATGVSECHSAQIWPLYHDLVEIIRPQHVALCQDFATKAVAAANENVSGSCGFSGVEWSTNRAAHVGHCMDLTLQNGPEKALWDGVIASRKGALRQCAQAKGIVLRDSVLGRSADVIAAPKAPAKDGVITRKVLQAARNAPKVVARSPGAADPAPTTGFAGTWETVTGSGNIYVMTLSQNGARVTGSYSPSNGTIDGTIGADGRLVYRWTEGSHTGTGVFRLAADGRTFSGSYSNSDDPNVVSSIWNGTRKE